MAKFTSHICVTWPANPITQLLNLYHNFSWNYNCYFVTYAYKVYDWNLLWIRCAIVGRRWDWRISIFGLFTEEPLFWTIIIKSCIKMMNHVVNCICTKNRKTKIWQPFSNLTLTFIWHWKGFEKEVPSHSGNQSCVPPSAIPHSGPGWDTPVCADDGHTPNGKICSNKHISIWACGYVNRIQRFMQTAENFTCVDFVRLNMIYGKIRIWYIKYIYIYIYITYNIFKTPSLALGKQWKCPNAINIQPSNTGKNAWVRSQHCDYWCPDAKAPCHQYPQCWLNCHCIGPVSYKKSCTYGVQD